jgi:CUG-BP- and ETR3-like factor
MIPSYDDSSFKPQPSQSSDADVKTSLFNLSTPSQMKINNTSVVIRPNYGKIDLKLFVGQIPKEWDENMVTDFFSGYGEILESQIIRDPKSGQSKGCAFVKFASMTKAEEAKRLIETKSITLPGVNNPIQIRWADGEDQRLGVDEQTIPKLFVGSIPKHATEENLNDVFTQFGHIEELVLMKDPDGTSKGCAFIRFKNKEDALLAMRFLNGNVYLGGSDKPIEVRFAENKKKTHPTTSGDTGGKHHPSGGNPNPHNPMSHMAPMNTMNPMNPMNPMGQMTSAPYYKYMAPDGNPYYLNPFTRQTQWDEPPPGSYVIPEPPEVPYYVKTQAPMKMPKKQGPSGSNLFVFHLPNEWKEEDLYYHFKDFGTIISCRIMRDRQTNRSRGFGFVSYDNAMSATMAVQRMNGFQAGSKRLKVDIKKGEDDEIGSTNTMASGTKFTPY